MLIWQQIAAAASSTSPRLQWPRPSVLLALQVAIVLLGALALAQPILGGSTQREHWIVVVDRTIAGTEAQPRLEAGINGARRLLSRRAPDIERITVIAVGSTAEITYARRPFDRAMATALGDGLSAVPGVADWREAARHVLLAMQAETPSRLVVVTDETPPDGWMEALGNPASEIVPIEAAASGNTLADVRLASDPASGGLLLTGKVGFAVAEPIRLAIGFTPAGTRVPLPWSTWGVTPRADGTGAPFSVPLELPGPGAVSVTAEEQPEVGTWSFVVRDQAAALDVLYVGAGEQPLVRALQAIEGVRVFSATELPEDISRFALIVIDKVVVPRIPDVSTIWIGSARLPDEPVPTAAGSRLPTAWDDGHALSNGIGWSQMAEVDAVALTPRAGEEVVVGSGDAPLVLAATSTGGRQVRLAFDPATEAWSEQTGFPQLVLNIVEWLGPLAGSDRVDAPCLAGAACRFDIRYSGGTVRPLDAQAPGSTLTASGGFVPEQPGLYELARGALRQLVAVNPPAPQTTVPPAATPPGEPAHPLWPWLAGGVAVLLLVEVCLRAAGPNGSCTGRD
ncbi:MAG: VWA domain-containing protein [Devosia sp.]|nr:VWA domain-containing protein [Devosia sp.]